MWLLEKFVVLWFLFCSRVKFIVVFGLMCCYVLCRCLDWWIDMMVFVVLWWLNSGGRCMFFVSVFSCLIGFMVVVVLCWLLMVQLINSDLMFCGLLVGRCWILMFSWVMFLFMLLKFIGLQKFIIVVGGCLVCIMLIVVEIVMNVLVDLFFSVSCFGCSLSFVVWVCRNVVVVRMLFCWVGQCV